MTLRTRLTEKLRMEHLVLLAVIKGHRGVGVGLGSCRSLRGIKVHNERFIQPRSAQRIWTLLAQRIFYLCHTSEGGAVMKILALTAALLLEVSPLAAQTSHMQQPFGAGGQTKFATHLGAFPPANELFN
jgi:hypothetical protein